ncbi:calcineurin binding protein-like protein [Dothidotthia symphoricarpi CBS 119687]|uniref:Calcineurin binding protein-like protein n=1 Tax=Dothidotthia symphoricarpi CBS 119687 TaxID=1392245 RepID=A0A6A6AG83_9PLEO|nr:calcineurin binding protein-like protein [Dothidotthia symphoricarpi CBS 119687]KAF2130790.1 calcineurin binding protein-like protein [Dothidotthia symphoricarpi CBS 119687]
MQATIPSPQRSRASSGRASPLSLDLSSLPPLIEPSPPSNTLIITNLNAPEIFQFNTLTEIRETINQHAKIHTWAPLKSFRRIVVSFFDIESAIQIRQTLDGESIMGYRIRVYFGLNTPLNPSDQHLPLPKSDKLFFISPPPSPPMGWEVKDEGAPNKIVHAEDLATALARLHAHANPYDAPSPTTEDGNPETSPVIRRRRTGSSTIVYHPDDHGDSPNLPAIAVEDTTEIPAAITPDAMEGVEGPIASQKAQGKNTSTARPPVELME